MTDITPGPGGLGLHSPKIGPWFTTLVTLQAPDPTSLSVALTPDSNGLVWLPPCAGTLSLIVPMMKQEAGETLRHRQLSRFQNTDGTPIVWGEADVLVAVFSILPEVYVRLEQIYASITGWGGPNRPVPGFFVVTVGLPTTRQDLCKLMFGDSSESCNGPSPNGNDTFKPEDFGLTFSDSACVNGDRPMAWLRRPGSFNGKQEALLHLASGDRLYVFDQDGLPIDPGAVAMAWKKMKDTYRNLAEAGDGYPAASDKKTLHLVGLAGGPADPAIRTAFPPSAGGELLDLNTQTTHLAFDSTALRERPYLRMALCPSGVYAEQLDLGSLGLMDRDFLRVSIVDMEHLLTGAVRSGPDAPEHQKRESTRTQIARSSADRTLLPNHEAVLGQIKTTLQGDWPVTIVCPVIDGIVGPLPDSDSWSDTDLPNRVTIKAIVPLHGGSGPIESGVNWAPAMQVMVQVSLLPVPEDGGEAWVRVMPLDFDLDTGERRRMVGGAGKATRTGGELVAKVVVTLPPGEANMTDGKPQPKVVFDIEVSSPKGTRLFGSVEGDRPDRLDSDEGAISLSTDGELWICETGQTLSNNAPVSIPNGSTVVAKKQDGSFAIVDPKTAPYNAFSESIGGLLRSGDVLVTTARVWEDSPRGDRQPRLEGSGAAVVYGARLTGVKVLERSLEAGAPFPTQERKEVLSFAQSAGVAEATLGGLPLRHQQHELSPVLPGRMGEPSASEAHSAGAHLTGPAALLAREAVWDRRYPGTKDLLDTAGARAPEVPPDPTAPGVWTALLRTVAAGVEGEPTLNVEVGQTGPYPFASTEIDARVDWFRLHGVVDLPSHPTNPGAYRRAADRRVIAAREGFTEAARCVTHLLGQARRFIYIETPLLDAGLEGATPDPLIDVVNGLQNSLVQNPQLYVLCCLPVTIDHPFDGFRRMRNNYRRRAIARIRGNTPDPGPPWSPPVSNRFVVFSPLGPGGRTCQLASSTVIVDDSVAITGGFVLTRRGLTFDSSVAVAAFDEQLASNRGRHILAFRQQLVADRLGSKAEHIPLDGGLLTRFVAEMLRTGSNNRTRYPVVTAPEPAPASAQSDQYDPDGRPRPNFNILDFINGLVHDASLKEALAKD